METIEIICFQCETMFEFTVDEQLRYEKMNFNEPMRCPDCRKKKLRPYGFKKEKHYNKQKFERSKFED